MKLRKLLAAAAATAVAISAMALTAISASAYNAYLGVQTNDSWIYRNAWNDTTYGRDVAGWDYSKLAANGAAADIPGTFTDVEITADGTYKVSLTGADLSNERIFSQLFVSTDIPLDSGVKVTNVNVYIDGQKKYTFDEAYIAEDTVDYIGFAAINIWNDDLGKEEGLFAYTMPNESVEMEFTVSGIGGAAAPADTGSETASTENTTAPTTGNVPAGVMLSVMAAAGLAAAASKKRK